MCRQLVDDDADEDDEDIDDVDDVEDVEGGEDDEDHEGPQYYMLYHGDAFIESADEDN